MMRRSAISARYSWPSGGRCQRRVIKTRPVLAPGGGGELRPFDQVVGVSSGRHIADPPGLPVRAGHAERVREQPAVVADLGRTDGGGAVRIEGVRVEQDRARIVWRFHHMQHRLVLQAVVAELEPSPAPLERHAVPGVAGQLGQLGPDPGAVGDAGQDLFCDLVLRGDPGDRLGIGRRLEPAVRVGRRVRRGNSRLPSQDRLTGTASADIGA